MEENRPMAQHEQEQLEAKAQKLLEEKEAESRTRSYSGPEMCIRDSERHSAAGRAGWPSTGSFPPCWPATSVWAGPPA